MAKKGKRNTKSKSNKTKSEYSGLFQATPRNFNMGGTVQPPRDLTRFVRWPRYVTIQRQKRVLMKRLKVPPAINQLTFTADSNDTKKLYSLLNKYAPENKEDKKARLIQLAKDRKEGKQNVGAKPNLLKFGLNQVTTLVEQRQAKLVVIAANVDPIELVCFLPALCRATETPFCIVKSQSVLGKFVGLKKTTCIAITNVDKADEHKLSLLQSNFKSKFNDNEEISKKYGHKVMGVKFRHKEAAEQKKKDAELIKKAT